MKRAVGVLVTVLLVAAGAGCSGPAGTAAPGRAAGAAPESLPASAQAMPPGIVEVTFPVQYSGSGNPRMVVSVFDPKTGARLRRALVATNDHGALAHEPDQTAFTPDLWHVAWVHECKLHVAALIADDYIEDTKPIDPPASFSDARACFSRPFFNPRDNRFWALVGSKLFSIDPKQPSAAPRDEGATLTKANFDRTGKPMIDRQGRPGTRVTLKLTGLVDRDGEIFASDGSVIPGLVGFALKDGASALDECPVVVDELNLLCGNASGLVVLLTVDLSKRVGTVRAVTPPSKGRGALLLSPDRTQLMIRNDNGFFVVAFDRTNPKVNQPTLALRELAGSEARGGSVLRFWL